MLTEIGELKPGDTYANRSRVVVRKESDFILIRKIADNWLVGFDENHPSWKFKVDKDEYL